MTKYTDNCGRRRVKLRRLGRRLDARVYRLVADAFLGECPPKHEINHKNHDKTDDRLENLEYVTRSYNMKHSYANGRTRPWCGGEINGHCKLTTSAVREIKLRYAAGGVTQRTLGEEYGVAASHISLIVRGVRWKHVE